MLKGGLFIDGKGIDHNVFILDLPNCYRVDICVPGAQFHIEPDKVEFSIMRKKKTFIYGDVSLHREMEELMDSLKFAKLHTETSSEWVDGKFHMKQTRGTDNQFFSEVLQVNGKTESELYKKGEQLLNLFVISDSASLAMDPMNKDEYEELELKSEIDVSVSPYVPISVLKTRFNLSHIEEKDYRVIKDVNEAREFLKHYKETNDIGGIDTETTGVDFNLYSTEKLVGVVLSDIDGRSVYFPFLHEKFENLPMSFLDEIAEACRYVHNKSLEKERLLGKEAVYELYDKEKGIYEVAHNKKFERKVFMKYNQDIPIKHDSMILSVMVNPVLIKGAHSLKNIESERTGKKYLELDDIFLDDIYFPTLDEETTRIYACPDSDNTRSAWYAKWKELPVDTRNIYEVEAELADLKAAQEYWGVRINIEAFRDDYENCKSSVDLLEKLIHTLTRSEFKITSGDQLSDLLYNRMKCPVHVRTKTGKASTGSKALKKLAGETRAEPFNIVKEDIRDSKGNILVKASKLNSSKYPVIILLEQYRVQVKLMTAFYNRIVKGSQGARYFFWINQNGAESGRQSSPMHQLPGPIRKILLSDSSEHYIYDSDYAQIELRLIASQAKEKALVELCRNPDNDIHRSIHSIISSQEIWSISSKDRQSGKSRNFGVVYLISGRGLAEQKHGAGATEEQIKDADESLKEFFYTFKRISKFIKNNRVKVEKDGKMRTFFGRYRYFDKIFDPELPNDKKQSLIRQGNNHPVQGTAADVMKLAEVNLNRYIINKGWDKLVSTPEGDFPLVRVMLSIHDQVLISGHKSIPAEEILIMKKECMELDIKGTDDEGEVLDFAPLFVSTSITTNWAEGKDDQFAMPHHLRTRLIDDYVRTGVSSLDMEDAKKSMLEIINKYRDEELITYMEDLVQEFGEDISLLSEKVRHPSLTHDLISRFKQSADHEKEHGKLSHIESISYAVERYLEFRKNPNFNYLPEAKEKTTKLEESSAVDYFEEITNMSDQLVYMDADGEIHYSESYDQEEDTLMFDDEMEHIHYVTSGETVKYWELFDVICIDTKGLLNSDVDELLKLVYKYNDPKGFFDFKLYHGGKMLETGIKIEKLDKQEILDFLESKINKEVI